MKKLLFLSVCFLSIILSGAVRVDPDRYGAGPMLKSARTFYVSTKGSDKNDGKTLKTAFRSISCGATHLRAGDTLLIEGGEYVEREIQINVKDGVAGFREQCGKPGSPIRIMGMKGHKVLLRGGYLLAPVGREGSVFKFKPNHRMVYAMVFEYPSGIELQRVYSKKLVHEYPGTSFFDKEKKELFVHFAALDQTHAVPLYRRIGIRIHGSYVHIENLHFTNFYEGIYIRMNRPYNKNKAAHNTIINCSFYNNSKNGIVIEGGSFTLVKNNRFYGNTALGSIMTQTDSSDNLITGNWCGKTVQTLRHERANTYDFAINNYGGMPPRNHVIGNYVDSPLAFRWKAACPGSVVRDNVFLGRFYAESRPVSVTVTNNVITDKVGWLGLGFNIWEKELASTPVKFSGNTRDAKKFSSSSPELARAKALAMKLPQPKFPKVTFTGLKHRFVTADGAAVSWETPECDGWGQIHLYDAEGKFLHTFGTGSQGSRHLAGISGLKPGTTYKYRAGFINRRGGKKSYSELRSFTTLAKERAPMVLEVGPGKLTLQEAAAAAIPGDTVKLLPGTHSGRFAPARSGLPGKPITLSGKGAILDGQKFFSPMVSIKKRSHIVIDGVTFINPESTARRGIINIEGGSDITVQNCHAPRFGWLAGSFISTRSTPGVVIKNNIIHGGDYPLSIVGGKKIRILNNTIVDATMVTLSIWYPDDMEIRDNIFYRPCVASKRSSALVFHDIRGKIVSEGNVHWSPVKNHPAGGRIRDRNGLTLKASKNLAEWQKISGMDKTSIHADPMFVDYKNGDFRLKPNSPAKGKGATL